MFVTIEDRQSAVVVAGKVECGQDHLPKVVLTLRSKGRFPNLLDSGKQQPDENGHDGDNDEQLD
jgi:hypothetical protein